MHDRFSEALAHTDHVANHGGMDASSSPCRRLRGVIWSLALALVVIGTIGDLVDAPADGLSAWDWVRAAALAGVLLSLGVLLLLRVRRRSTAIDRGAVDLARVRDAQEREGRVAAVREVRRQDPALSLVEATRLVDAL